MRKSICSLAVTIVIAFTLQSCGTNSPKAAAGKFLNSFYHMEFDEAKKVSTEDTKKMLDMLGQFAPMIPDSSKAQLKKTKVDIKTVVENTDTSSTVTYVTSDNPKDQTLHMVKKNGKWLAQWTKQDGMGGADAGQQNDPGTPAPANANAPADTSAPAATDAPKQ